MISTRLIFLINLEKYTDFVPLSLDVRLQDLISHLGSSALNGQSLPGDSDPVGMLYPERFSPHVGRPYDLEDGDGSTLSSFQTLSAYLPFIFLSLETFIAAACFVSQSCSFANRPDLY
jgi:hypothetical protein